MPPTGNLPPTNVLRDVRAQLTNWLNGLQHMVSQETGKPYPPETTSITGNTVQGCLVDINRITVKIQQILVEYPELHEKFGAIAA
jgi:hypothetical protein